MFAAFEATSHVAKGALKTLFARMDEPDIYKARFAQAAPSPSLGVLPEVREILMRLARPTPGQTRPLPEPGSQPGLFTSIFARQGRRLKPTQTKDWIIFWASREGCEWPRGA